MIRIAPKGDVLIRHFETGEEIWADYYDIEFADPYSNPEALLIALAHIKNRLDNEFDDPSGTVVEGKELPHVQAIDTQSEILLP